MNLRAANLERRFAAPVLLAALLVIPVIVIEESGTGGRLQDAARVANWAIWSVFAAEAIATTAAADHRGRWLRHHWFEVAIVVATVPFYPASLQAGRALRLLRVLRVLRIPRVAGHVFSVEGMRYVALVAGLTILGGGAAFAAVEKNGMTVWDGIWWAITTMTTVGYGPSPTTDAGRAITIAVLAIGIGFVAFFTGAIAERFLRADAARGERGDVDDDVLSELRELRRQVEALEARLVARGPSAGPA